MSGWTQEEMQRERDNARMLIGILQAENLRLKEKLKYYEDRREKLDLVDMSGD